VLVSLAALCRPHDEEYSRAGSMTALEMAKALRVAYTLDKEPG
jgi:hypothetical protein